MSDDDEPRRRRQSGPAPAGQDDRGARPMAKRVKSAKGRKISSTLWLQRQLNDPYVAKAKERGYRSRAAFKLVELDEKYGLLKRGARVVDLGSAPGGWLQVALERGASRVVGVDYLEMEPVPGTEILQLDFTEEGASERVRAALGGPADLVISDMAAPTTGHRPTDQTRTGALTESAADFAIETLAPGGAFVAKAFQGGLDSALLDRLKKAFTTVRHAKPASSRAGSKEVFVVATGFRGAVS
jgi:23S rRNA (uridine2552-2'-O)-methyltransferase